MFQDGYHRPEKGLKGRDMASHEDRRKQRMQDFGRCGSWGLAKLKLANFGIIFDKMKVCVVGSQPPPPATCSQVVNFSQRHSLTNHF